MDNKIANDSLIAFQKHYYDIESGTLLSPIATQNYVIAQVGDSYYRNCLEQSPHKQYFDLELTVAVKNDAMCYADAFPTKIAKDQIFLSFKGEFHNILSKSSFRFKYLAFNIDPKAEIYPLFCFIKEKIISPKSRVFQIAEVSYIITDILGCLNQTDFLSKQLFIDNKITEILFLLYRALTRSKNFELFNRQDLLPDIISFIDSNFKHIHSTMDIADRFGYSYSYISRLFKKLYNTTLQQYLITKRMDYALLLLKQFPPSEVASKLNYSSVYNFSRAFKNYFKLSPINYLKQNLIAQEQQ